jgi:hypothetical protein
MYKFFFCINILPQVVVLAGVWTVSLFEGFNHIKHWCIDL